MQITNVKIIMDSTCCLAGVPAPIELLPIVFSSPTPLCPLVTRTEYKGTNWFDKSMDSAGQNCSYPS